MELLLFLLNKECSLLYFKAHQISGWERSKLVLGGKATPKRTPNSTERQSGCIGLLLNSYH